MNDRQFRIARCYPPPQIPTLRSVHPPGLQSLKSGLSSLRHAIPSTLGQDIFLLSNPRGLHMQYEGFTAQVTTQHRFIDFHASFTAEKSFGPTNPGDGVLENDSGVIWGLYVHVCKLETLRQAYRLAKANDGAPGIDGVTFAG